MRAESKECLFDTIGSTQYHAPKRFAPHGRVLNRVPCLVHTDICGNPFPARESQHAGLFEQSHRLIRLRLEAKQIPGSIQDKQAGLVALWHRRPDTGEEEPLVGFPWPGKLVKAKKVVARRRVTFLPNVGYSK